MIAISKLNFETEFCVLFFLGEEISNKTQSDFEKICVSFEKK